VTHEDAQSHTHLLDLSVSICTLVIICASTKVQILTHEDAQSHTHLLDLSVSICTLVIICASTKVQILTHEDAQSHTHLLDLNLCGCEKLTDNAVMYVAHACVELQALNTMGCTKVSVFVLLY
jgi:hypothetical protein